MKTFEIYKKPVFDSTSPDHIMQLICVFLFEVVLSNTKCFGLQYIQVFYLFSCLIFVLVFNSKSFNLTNDLRL